MSSTVHAPGAREATIGTKAKALIEAFTPCDALIVQCDKDSAADLWVLWGDGAIRLEPGDALTLPIANAQEVLVEAQSGTATFSWMARTSQRVR